MAQMRFEKEPTLEETGGHWSGLSVCGTEFVVVNYEKVKRFGEDEKEITIQELKQPHDVKVIGDEMYISDKEGRAVIVSDKDGKMLDEFRLPKDDDTMSEVGLAVDEKEKDVYVSTLKTIRDPTNPTDTTDTIEYMYIVYKWNKTDKEFQPFITEGLSQPWYMCTDADGNLYVSNNVNYGTVKKYKSNGTLMWTYEPSESHRLLQPRGVCTDNKGHIFIVDSKRVGIQVITDTGHFLRYVDIGEQINNPWAIGFGEDKLYVTTDQAKIYKIKVEY